MKNQEDGLSAEHLRLDNIKLIIEELPSLGYTHILDIADNIFWSAKLFYNPDKESVIDKRLLDRLKNKYPEEFI